MLSGPDLSRERIAAEVDDLIASAGGEEPPGEVELIYELRYAGQAFELPVAGGARPDPAELAERFEQAHRERYGHTDPDAEVVLVHIRLALVSPGPRPRPAAPEGAEVAELSRPVPLGGEWVETPVLRGEPGAGIAAPGPIVFELPEATFLVPPGWSTRVDEAGTIAAEKEAGR